MMSDCFTNIEKSDSTNDRSEGYFNLRVFIIVKFVYLYLHTGCFSKMSSYIWAFLRTPNVRSPLFPIFYDIQAFKSWAI